MTNFWQTWLRLWCLFVGLFGTVLAGATFDPTDAPLELLISILSAQAFE